MEELAVDLLNIDGAGENAGKEGTGEKPEILVLVEVLREKDAAEEGIVGLLLAEFCKCL